MVWISSWLREVEVEGLSLDIRYCWLLSTHTLNRASGVPTYAKINPLDTRAPRRGWIFSLQLDPQNYAGALPLPLLLLNRKV